MGGDHHHGHHKPYTVPDWKIYNVKDVPQLVEVENALAAKGLKDPWLRNEVWRYDPKQFSTHGNRITSFLFRGFKYGLALTVATIAIETALGSPFMGPRPHAHHGDDHGEGHGEGGHH